LKLLSYQPTKKKKGKKRKSKKVNENIARIATSSVVLCEKATEVVKNSLLGDVSVNDVRTAIKNSLKPTNRFHNKQDAISFGLRNETGDIVEVIIPKEEAERFQTTVSKILYTNQETNNQMSIPELLYELDNQFTILDVKWPFKIEDEEEEEFPARSQKEEGQEENRDDMGDMEDMDIEIDQDFDEELPPEIQGMVEPEQPAEQPAPQNNEVQEDMMTLLQTLIQGLIADAEARRQEALKGAAEARAKEAEYAAKIAELKLSAEEEIADMEAYYASEEEAAKEAKKMARLAKYRHDVKKSTEEDKLQTSKELLAQQEEDDYQALEYGEDDIDLSLPIDDQGYEDVETDLKQTVHSTVVGDKEEEEETDNKRDLNMPRRFKGIGDAVKYLNSFLVQKQARND
jgi:hypothetical protein